MLLGKFAGEYDYTNILRYTGYSYLTNNELNSVSLVNELDAFVNANELVQSGVINQILTNIYQTQLNLAELTQVFVKNTINTDLTSIE